jgi:Xaa-Pro aminopeptidase
MTESLDINLKEYQNRRTRLAKSLGDAVALVFAGETIIDGRFKPDDHFVYLTGIKNEPGAVLMFDKHHENADRRIILFLKPINPEADQWDGFRPGVGSALREKTGIKTILRTPHLPSTVTTALRKSKRAACLHALAVYPAAVSADLNVFQQVAQRVPGVRVEDQSHLLTSQRAVKSEAELRLIQHAAHITEQAYLQALPHVRAGMNESRLQLALETVYKQHGGDVAYGSIVGGGFNGTVLHYVNNNQPLNDGDLIVIDSAASFGGYASDITRTIPVNGIFSDEQKEIYNVVLAAQLAAIKACKPGVPMYAVDAAARKVIERAGYGDAFVHSIGHPLGLAVHDVVPDHALVENMVITIEPGIYLPDRRLGVRIEDDILITKTGHRVLTPNVPKTVKDIEALMRR